MHPLASLLYGLLAYAFFLASFLYAVFFVGNAFVPRTIDVGPAAPLWQAIVIDLALLGVFAVQHSVMARRGFKRWWTSLVPKPVERSTFVLFTCAVLGALFWQWRA